MLHSGVDAGKAQALVILLPLHFAQGGAQAVFLACVLHGAGIGQKFALARDGCFHHARSRPAQPACAAQYAAQNHARRVEFAV